MTRPIRSYPEEERRMVIKRRLQQKAGGLGYISAVIAAKKYYRIEIPQEDNHAYEATRAPVSLGRSSRR